uniref:Prothymosin alpha n=1 Tax=Ursus maritimus TaxID=29073 RepID=A0A452SXB2_URSMA
CKVCILGMYPLKSLQVSLWPESVPIAAVDTSSEITTNDLKEREEWWRRQRTQEAHLLTGTLMEEDGEQEADNEVDEGEDVGQQEKEGDGEEENGEEDEEAEAATGSRAAEDEEEVANTKKQKTNQDDYTAKKEKLN